MGPRTLAPMQTTRSRARMPQMLVAVVGLAVVVAWVPCTQAQLAASPDTDSRFVFDYLGGGNPQSPAYLRCKMTHR